MMNQFDGLVTAMTSRTGRPVSNQYIIRYPDGAVYFQSYNTIVCKVADGKIYLNRNAWLSRTTRKYLAKFLEMNAAELNKSMCNFLDL